MAKDKVKLTKSDKRLIEELSKTKTIRELARVLLSYLTVEQMSNFLSIYLVLKNRGQEEKVLGYFVKDQFFPLIKTITLALGDLLPDFLTDSEFRKVYSKVSKNKFDIKGLFKKNRKKSKKVINIQKE
jgi:hypothetical protein